MKTKPVVEIPRQFRNDFYLLYGYMPAVYTHPHGLMAYLGGGVEEKCVREEGWYLLARFRGRHTRIINFLVNKYAGAQLKLKRAAARPDGKEAPSMVPEGELEGIRARPKSKSQSSKLATAESLRADFKEFLELMRDSEFKGE